MPWGFPILCSIAARLGRSPAFCPKAVKEVAEVEAPVEAVVTTPEVQGTATTGSGITGEIVYYPGEAVFKYGVQFPEPYHIWSKGPEFRTYDDAQWYITDVVSPAPADTTGEAPEEPSWEYLGRAQDTNGKVWWTYGTGMRRKVVDPKGEEGPYEFETWMAMNAWLWPPEEKTPTGIEEEKRKRGEIARMGLRVY